MNKDKYIINRKLNILDLSETLGNISEACRKLGVSRQHYYDIKKAVEEEGVDALVAKAKTRSRRSNQIPQEWENAILEYSLHQPMHGQVRVANELKRLQNIHISPAGVRQVWLRHDLTKRDLRLKRLEKWAAGEQNILTESQIQALEAAKEEKQAHGEIESYHPGFLLGQDTCYIGYIKGIGRIYQQTGIDTYSNVGFAKLYLDKTAMTAADFLNDKVLPFFDEHGIHLLRTLTDRGTEYCGNLSGHPYQLFLHLNDIEHSRTKARHPQTNGCTERLNQTILDEFYRVELRKKIYKTLEELQADLDAFMKRYNEDRTNQGKYCRGRTPMETFREGIEIVGDYVSENEGEKELESAA